MRRAASTRKYTKGAPPPWYTLPLLGLATGSVPLAHAKKDAAWRFLGSHRKTRKLVEIIEREPVGSRASARAFYKLSRLVSRPDIQEGLYRATRFPKYLGTRSGIFGLSLTSLGLLGGLALYRRKTNGGER